MADADLSAARLRELLHYDPLSGAFTWRTSGKGRRPDSAAGSVSQHGYVKIGVDGAGQKYAHRLAWLYMTGEWPKYEIDHIDGDRANNRFANLRDVKAFVNQQNKRKPQSNCDSGVLGVSWVRSRKHWVAQIRIPGVGNRAIGTFRNKDAAAAAYLAAKRRLHEGCTI